VIGILSQWLGATRSGDEGGQAAADIGRWSAFGGDAAAGARVAKASLRSAGGVNKGEEVFAVPMIYGTAEHWLARAREARELAAQMDDPVARDAMLAVADNYEIVAKRAEAREVGLDIPNFPKTDR
jgi:hypothetical protein